MATAALFLNSSQNASDADLISIAQRAERLRLISAHVAYYIRGMDSYYYDLFSGADMPIIAFPHGASVPAIQRTLEALAPHNALGASAVQSETT